MFAVIRFQDKYFSTLYTGIITDTIICYFINLVKP